MRRLASWCAGWSKTMCETHTHTHPFPRRSPFPPPFFLFLLFFHFLLFFFYVMIILFFWGIWWRWGMEIRQKGCRPFFISFFHASSSPYPLIEPYPFNVIILKLLLFHILVIVFFFKKDLQQRTEPSSRLDLFFFVVLSALLIAFAAFQLAWKSIINIVSFSKFIFLM